MSWNEVKTALNSTLGDAEFKTLDGIIKEEIAALKSEIPSLIPSVGNVPIVKSVQRGTVDDGDTSKSGTGTVYFSSVDINKAIILLDGTGNIYGPDYDGDNHGAFGVKITNVTTNSFQYRRFIYQYQAAAGSGIDCFSPGFSWQVIEFH